jgi:predicted transposase
MYNTPMQRTIRIQLHPSQRQAIALAETSRLFTSAFNQAVRLGWESDVSNATKLHYLAYYPVNAGGLRNQPIVSTSDSFGREAQAAPF